MCLTSGWIQSLLADAKLHRGQDNLLISSEEIIELTTAKRRLQDDALQPPKPPPSTDKKKGKGERRPAPANASTASGHQQAVIVASVGFDARLILRAPTRLWSFPKPSRAVAAASSSKTTNAAIERGWGRLSRFADAWHIIDALAPRFMALIRRGGKFLPAAIPVATADLSHMMEDDDRRQQNPSPAQRRRGQDRRSRGRPARQAGHPGHLAPPLRAPIGFPLVQVRNRQAE
ncbi:hypothetical protein BC940DRAFT_318481 [Gongronella butleri]|nr:hypothetical protein BC940DRAFT_318481 [Gongronella butleri]